MTFQKSLVAIFTLAAGLSGCSMSYTREDDRKPVLRQMMIADRQLFLTRKYDIVARRDYGRVQNDNIGEITEHDYHGRYTDVCYTLKKVPDDKKRYKGCVRHEHRGPVVVGIQLIP